MAIRLSLAVAAFAAAAGTAAPASADVCSFVNVTKDRPVTVCVPYGTPLPPLGCPVQAVDLLVVCDRSP